MPGVNKFTSLTNLIDALHESKILDFELDLDKQDTDLCEKIFKKKNNQPTFSHDIKIEQRKIDLRLQFDNMLQSIKNNISPINSFKEAYENFQIISAIENSVKKGTVINTT